MPRFTQSGGTSAIAISNRKRRALLFQSANGRCFYCGDPVFEPECHHPRDWLMLRANGSHMVREHKIPTVREGGDDAANVVCACRTCNGLKGSFTTDEYRMLMALRRGDLDFRFPGEAAAPSRHDWLICHSDNFERDLLTHNMPEAGQAYALRSSSHQRSKTWRPLGARA